MTEERDQKSESHTKRQAIHPKRRESQEFVSKLNILN